MSLRIKATLEFEIELKNPIVTEEDPSPPGIGLPRAKERFIEPDDVEVAKELFYELGILIWGHSRYKELPSFVSDDPELFKEFLDDLYKDYNLNVEVVK